MVEDVVELGGSGVELLALAVERLLAEDPSLLAPELALGRTAALLRGRERVQAATLAAVRDVDGRELYALEQAGSTGSWLRRQVGGQAGQLLLARRLLERPVVAAAFAAGLIAQRPAGQLCAMLDRVPDDVAEPRLAGALADGIGSLLTGVTGWTGLAPEQLPPATAALRREVSMVLADCLAQVGACPAVRLEPAVLLLARHLPAGQLGWALELVLDALDPTAPAEPLGSRFSLELQPVLDGEWDLRGHLDPETGALLAAELDRQERATNTAAAQNAAAQNAAAQNAAADNATADGDPEVALEVDGAGEADVADGEAADGQAWDGAAWDGETADDETWDDETWDGAVPDDLVPDHVGADAESAHPVGPADEVFFAGLDGPRDEHQTSSPRRLLLRGARRHAALGQLLRDAADHDTGGGRPAPAVLLLTATVDQLQARPGSLPALLHTVGPPVPLARETLQRLGCHSELNMVVLDALGRPVGASTTLRSATHRQRLALRAVWGPWCAVAGCSQTATVPHHVRPWWSSRHTVLHDLLPLCQHDHRDLHEGHRTLRLTDGRHIDEHGWTTPADPAAAPAPEPAPAAASA